MSPKKPRSSSLPTTSAEWASFSISLLLLAGVVGLIVTFWVREPGGPPRFRVEVGAVRAEAGKFHLPVTVTNHGGSAASQVRLEGRLNAHGSEERPVTTIDFLPVRAREEAVLIFEGEPTGVRVEVVSYQKP